MRLKLKKQDQRIKLFHGDCLEVMSSLPSNSIDMCLTDPPYQMVNCKWDLIIPFNLMWEQVKRIVKDNGAICLFGCEPFSSKLRLSNLKMFKYDWRWEKDKATNHLNAKKQPMRKSEIISVFYHKQCLYRPQFKTKDINNIRPSTTKRDQAENYNKMTKESKRIVPINLSYPDEILKFRGVFGDKGKSYHPTQKPVPLLEYLIKTYTLENETVLDFTMGSGSTGVAAINLNRKFIGIEKEEKYFDIGTKRIRQALSRF